MFLVQWSCEVPQDNLERFIAFAEKKLKPFYESYGCVCYELFFPITTEKKYFPYQITENKNRYTEQLLFSDFKDFEKFYESIEKEQAAQDIVGMYVKKFGITDCRFKILQQKI